MNKQFNGICQQYVAALRRYLVENDESALSEAYELGRKTISDGLGVIDMAKIHEEVLLGLLPKTNAPFETLQLAKSAGSFFSESLSPFEITHRGFRDANRSLRKANADLEDRNQALAIANGNLKREIEERKRAERELRESEEHYRILFNQARLMQENLRHLSSQVLHVQEEERKRISRELHDEVGQALTAVNVSLALLKNAIDIKNVELRNKITDTQKLLEQTMESVHAFSRELRPAMLDDLGLIPTLRSFVKSFARRTGIQVSFWATDAVEKLAIDQKTVLYRVGQESLTNIAKHAHASHGAVTIRKSKNGFAMEIKDNGKSFQVDQKIALKGKNRLGLLGIQERVKLADGEFKVESTPGKGTKLLVWIPMNGSNGLITRRI
ncbi:histidine kinase [Pedosphaera parvula]|uniref:histidine kinase n=1 Tax=Pedosphaera parvula (strain Ellin514) TaxID=320771 RepID=B9X9T9_PEDPL|nr:histidine kinase [Pedosphaera parvula]EEF63240.1 histidine kinase [Pedosphaera parvula Ellin514]